MSNNFKLITIYLWVANATMFMSFILHDYWSGYEIGLYNPIMAIVASVMACVYHNLYVGDSNCRI